jgi:hypothetical protein
VVEVSRRAFEKLRAKQAEKAKNNDSTSDDDSASDDGGGGAGGGGGGGGGAGGEPSAAESEASREAWRREVQRAADEELERRRAQLVAEHARKAAAAERHFEERQVGGAVAAAARFAPARRSRAYGFVSSCWGGERFDTRRSGVGAVRSLCSRTSGWWLAAVGVAMSGAAVAGPPELASGSNWCRVNCVGIHWLLTAHPYRFLRF